MISLSSRAFFFFFRISSTGQLTNSHVLRSLTQHYQAYHCYTGLNYISKESVSNNIHRSMGWDKKRKKHNSVWRPISTQATSDEVTEVADSSISSLSLEAEAEAEVVKAEGVQVNPGSAGVSGLKDAEGVYRDGMTASAPQDDFRTADAESSSIEQRDKHAVSVEVGASVMRFIRGKDKSVQKDIEEEMGVKLLFPSSKNEDSIVIESDSMDAITKASEKIQAIVDEAIKSPALNYSHFISLPLAIHAELVNKLTRFQSTILGDSESKDADGTMEVDTNDEISEDEETSDKPETASDVAVQLKVDDTNNVKVDIKNIPLVSYACKAKTPTELGIDKSIFIKPKTFHLTVLMLKLWNKRRVDAAKEVLQSVYSEVMEVLDNRPLFVRLKGLDCLRGSKGKAQVLYAPIEEIGNEGRLLRACQIISDAYVKAGLVLEKDAQQKLRLHATVMNTTHRKRARSKRRRKDTFDARGILEQFGSEQWGDYHIREAHLSQRFLYDENGYYHCCGSIPFPEISEVPECSTTQPESVDMPVAESI